MRALVFAAVLFAAAPTAAQETRSEARVELAIGERYVVPENDISSYSESGPGVYDIEFDQARRMVLIGRRLGAQSLLLIFSDGTQRRYVITVTS